MAAREDTTENISRRFPTTSWTMICEAGRKSSHSAEALSGLCTAYWYPVYGFVRRRGHSREQAEDLTQEFFARILEQGSLSAARRDRGKFRSFLLASTTNFLMNEWDRTSAQKRGGGAPALSLDFEVGEARYCREPSHGLTPEALFERQWALALLDRVLARLREEYSRKKQESHFDRLRPFLTGEQERGQYQQLAFELNATEGAARTAVHRLRRRYGELVREEISATVADPKEVDGEIGFLLAALKSG